MIDVFPVYEFRPKPGYFGGAFLRYAGGEWLPDDGATYDLAFGAAEGPAFALYVEAPHQRNIVWSWTDGHWTKPNRDHPRANPWHYALKPGETEWGGTNWGRNQHPNVRAADSAMNKVCSIHRSASGHGIRRQPGDEHVLAGLVREVSTSALLREPERAECMYCAKVWTPDGRVCEAA